MAVGSRGRAACCGVTREWALDELHEADTGTSFTRAAVIQGQMTINVSFHPRIRIGPLVYRV